MYRFQVPFIDTRKSIYVSAGTLATETGWQANTDIELEEWKVTYKPTARRQFLLGVGGASVLATVGCTQGSVVTQPTKTAAPVNGVEIATINGSENILQYITRIKGQYDHDLFKAVIGAANPYKEGDESLGIAASSEQSRSHARTLISNTRIGDLLKHPMLEDAVYALVIETTDTRALAKISEWTMGELKAFLLTRPEEEIKAIMPGLSSDIIGMVVKLMNNDELIKVGQTVFNPLPNSQIGAKGYMGARVQPNSPTDHPDDIQWQVFNAWAFGVGDVVLGNNPVSGEIEKIAGIERALKEILDAFKLQDFLPHCCLTHIDAQAQIEKLYPGLTALWFQSLGSTVDANAVFDVTVDKMLTHAKQRQGKYGLYFETGQGADATNGASAGFDMVIHESRKYGFARALKQKVASAQQAAGSNNQPWVHLNDVAGFIGPEVFRTKEQLVRCCLEDIAMGKLHGLTIGLDICSTLHMSVGLDDLDWCIDQIMPANPAYLMALPTKNDPMLSYLSTSVQDHVRIRNKFGYKVSNAIWDFFQRLGVVNSDGSPGPHFGDPTWVYMQFRRALKDTRSDTELRSEASRKIQEVRSRGVWIAEGHGTHPWDIEPKLEKYIRNLVDDGKKMIYTTLPAEYEKQIAPAIKIKTESVSRDDYILHPPTGEKLSSDSLQVLNDLRTRQGGDYNIQIMISDGLNANAITDKGHVDAYLPKLQQALQQSGMKVAPDTLVCTSGRVRAGYRTGEVLFGARSNKQERCAMLHIIGERPGSEHHSFSIYLSAPPVSVWSTPGKLDHDVTKVIANVADTALVPDIAVTETVRILKQMMAAPA